MASLDGKINSGSSDALDVDRDWCKLDGVKEGLRQYYDIEQTTDLCSFNSGKVMAKIGVNTRTDAPPKSPCTFVIVDNRPHLNENGIDYLCRWVERLLLVTTNRQHAAFGLQEKYPNLTVLYDPVFDPERLFEDLSSQYGIERMTIQSGGRLNGLLLRKNLIDDVHVVLAPVLVGGGATPTMIDGDSITSVAELHKLRALRLLECRALDHSYVELKYQVIR